MLIDNIRLPLESNDMLLYANPEQRPQQHPSLKFVIPKRQFKPEFRQLPLWNEIGSESNPNESKE